HIDTDADLSDDATEVTLDESAIIPAPRATLRLPETPDTVLGFGEFLASPLTLLPPDTQAHLRTAGREAALVATSLAATLLKGTAIVLNIAGEALRDYTDRNSRVIDLQAARQARQRVEIKVE